MPNAWILAPLGLAVVLASSAWGKRKSAGATLAAMAALHVPTWLRRRWLAAVLPYVESVLALGLLVGAGPVAALVGALTLGLFALYWVLVFLAVGRPEQANCNCFGEDDEPVTGWTLGRNSLLLVLGAIAMAGAIGRGGLWPTLVTMSAGDWWWLAGGLLLLALLAVLGRRAPAARGAHPESTGRPQPDEAPYLRTPIPLARLQTLAGGVTTLREIASTMPRLLLFLSPTCAACHDVAARVEEWRVALPEIGIHGVFVSDGDELRRTMPQLLDSGYFEEFGTASQLFEIKSNPAAVLLGADGLVAGGPVLGSAAIFEFVDQIREQLAAAKGESPAP